MQLLFATNARRCIACGIVIGEYDGLMCTVHVTVHTLVTFKQVGTGTLTCANE